MNLVRGIRDFRKLSQFSKVIAFLTDHAVVNRIISHLKLMFVAEKPPPFERNARLD